MSKLIRNLLLVAPAAVSLVIGSQLSASAQSVSDINNGSQLLNQINSYSQEGKGTSRNQVTNVNQLRDVSPTDWAYEALRSLVDRYGCISGFPNQTYRGTQPLSRYEFAAGLNSCLNQIERLIASQDQVSSEDIDTINRLSQEFEAELATIGGRVDEIESRTAVLEDSQFSTTTKLEGEVVFGLSSEFGSSDFNELVFQDRVRLAFVSSFFGEDALYTRIDAGNATAGFNTTVEVGEGATATEIPTPLETGGLTYNFDNGNNIEIGWLAYYFPIGDKIDVYLPAAFPLWVDFAPSLSPYLDSFTGASGSLSSFAESSPIYKIGLSAGGGVGFNFNPIEAVTISAGYFGGDSFNPIGADDGGLINEEYSALGQIAFSFLDDKLQLAGTYVLGQFGAGSNEIFDLGVGTANATQPFGGGTKVAANSYGVEAAFQLSDFVAVNAFGMFTDAQEAAGSEDAEIISYGVGLSFPDLGKEGNLAAIFAGAEPYVSGTSITRINENGEEEEATEDAPIHIEGLYKYQFNDNISITPGVVYIINPNGGEADEEDAIVGVLRTTFTF
ncbi:carbohydrate porin [Waterburya agarophytonicola K14]|uniref:Carbohydrate porin n=1 Tax=Waterburya agarophytonicola KI4 TaxID=2874699 RepID=A0A964FEN5_9CYAN|nr:iron uptake porin [Waterburya agarophytonicola]MCC0176890.1 carbohydrate porin [Waterburya agarophytonicola KI4]